MDAAVGSYHFSLIPEVPRTKTLMPVLIPDYGWLRDYDLSQVDDALKTSITACWVSNYGTASNFGLGNKVIHVKYLATSTSYEAHILRGSRLEANGSAIPSGLLTHGTAIYYVKIRSPRFRQSMPAELYLASRYAWSNRRTTTKSRCDE